MRLVIQKVSQGAVTSEIEAPAADGAEGTTTTTETASIERGLVALVGFERDDTDEDLEAMAKALLKLRLFAPAGEDPRNRRASTLSLADAGAGLLLVSQFTLAAAVKSGRPTFHRAKDPDVAKDMFERFVARCRDGLPAECTVGAGVFGTWMQVHVVNEGPFTICLSAKDGKCDAW